MNFSSGSEQRSSSKVGLFIRNYALLHHCMHINHSKVGLFIRNYALCVQKSAFLSTASVLRFYFVDYYAHTTFKSRPFYQGLCTTHTKIGLFIYCVRIVRYCFSLLLHRQFRAKTDCRQNEKVAENPHVNSVPISRAPTRIFKIVRNNFKNS